MVYTVHTAVRERVPVTVELKGAQVEAHVPGLTVELVGGDADHAHTFRLVPMSDEEMAAHEALFQPGTKVQAAFTRVEG